ncbi:TolC family protein [Acidiphilium iwatense]|uniref:TolC family protein n=2 Tax=Acidiphilium iwatense TaxID=768198 RepID=A0ABS9DUJ8_9PROT|nr:TolC family protein [Acidiphilium iwatense]
MAGLVRTALVARPSVRTALARYQADQEDLRQAIDAQFPGVTIGPGYHYDQGDNKFLLAISLPLPVLNQNQGPIAVARAKRRRAAAQFQAAQLHVLDQVGRAERNYRASVVAEAEADRIAARARVQARAARAAYRAGATGRVRLLGAEQADILARQNALAAEIQVRTALGQLEDGLHHRFFGSGA